MDNKSASKRRKDKHSDNEERRDKKATRRRRTRSRSNENHEKDSRRKRKHSRSRSPNVPVKQEKRRDDTPNDVPPKKAVPERKTKETDMLNTRTGGAYIPPARLRMMQAQITDKSSVSYQRLAWEALKKSIHGHINKINVGNIGIIIKELLKENIVRGRGLLCRSVIQAQAASPTFTNVYAALVSAVNSRFPNIGELLLKRLVIQFKRGFKRNDKPTCISSASFIAHLVNQRVAHEILALELLTLLVESPTDDSVEVAIAFLKECGQKLTEVSSKGVNAIFEMLRNILHEGHLDKRVQYMIEVMFQVWKDGFKDHPALIEELELVPEEEQFTHLLMLDDATDPQDILNVFKFDDKYEENEQKYKTLSKEILGSDAESGEEDDSEATGSGESEDEEEQEGEQKGVTIIDNTETNLVALRRTIYLTINSSLDFEECAHKLMKMQLKPGQEVELCNMFLDCCAEQRTYEKFYGLLAQRFCNVNRIYIGPFEEIFKDSYSTAHRLDTNRLRNVSKFFAHLLFTDSISWEVMECVRLNEEDTTSSSRIYIKILFQELAEYMGLKKLNDRLKDPTLQGAFSGIFPRDNPKNTRFSINFFTSIGLGGLTDELREHLKQMPKNIPAPITDINVESESSSSSSSSDSSSESSSSGSDSEEENEKLHSKNSSEQYKSKQNNDATHTDLTNTDKNKKDQRWGHDGFYETYGENARRHDSRPERSGQNNFTRPRDLRLRDDRETQKGNERVSKDDRTSRDVNERRSHRNSNDIREHQMNTDNRRQERERSCDKQRDKINGRNAKDDSRYEKPSKSRSHREDKRRDEVYVSNKDGRADEMRRTKDHARDRDINSNKGYSERNDRDKYMDRNNKARDCDRNKDDRSSERISLSERQNEMRDKSYRNERIQEDGQNKNDRIRDRKSEKEKRDKSLDRNYTARGDERKNKEGKSYDRNLEREQRGDDINDGVRNINRNKDKKTEDTLNNTIKKKNVGRDEEKKQAGKNKDNNDTYEKNKKKRNDNIEEENSRCNKKRDDDDNTRKNSERKKILEHNGRQDKGKKYTEITESSHKKKSKKTKKRHTTDKRGEDSSLSDSSSSDSSTKSTSGESENEQTGSRYWDSFDIEKPIHIDREISKSNKMKEKRKGDR